jgi:RNA polymerase sigma-70 factor (ECF subfamily)
MEGLSQREIAKRLGVSESVVENDVQKALRTIQRALRTDPGCGPGDSPPEKDFTDVDERRKFEVYG